MKRANLPWHTVTPARIHWQDNGEPNSCDFHDIYYSRDNGLEECEHVFLQGNEIARRLSRHRDNRFYIGETGFGTGLNFLCTWRHWSCQTPPRPDLHYVAVEKFPLRRRDITAALALWPELKPQADELLAHYPDLVPGQHRLALASGKVTLDLWWCDVQAFLSDLCGRNRPYFDAWYLDGFAPARNTAMWQQSVLQSVARLTRRRGSFATFTAAGQVRRDLGAAGFDVEKTAGYGRKRECLRGRLSDTTQASPESAETPWDIPARASPPPKTALVIGAGLAGCTTAAALALRGVAVTVLDMGSMAGAGSGNEQGVLYTRLSPRHSALTDFALISYRHATRLYADLFNRGDLQRGVDGDLCGSFHLDDDSKTMAVLYDRLHQAPELAQVKSATEATDIVGLPLTRGGYWFPGSGWINPAAACRALSGNEGITVHEHCGPVGVQYDNGVWRACSEQGKTLAQADCAVLATGASSTRFAQLNWLSLGTVRGQVTAVTGIPELCDLRTVLCHDGYLAPDRDGTHWLGATFTPGSSDTATRPEDNADNLAQLATAVPALAHLPASLDSARLPARASLRCTSSDYLPVVGPVPQHEQFLRQYADLRKNARQTIPHCGSYIPGLYVNTAHGSRGLTSTPLAAELLASQICGEPPPMDRDLCRALAPARFIIRDLRRNRI